MKKKTTAKVISHTQLSPGIYDLWIETELAAEAHCGQFVGVYTGDPSMLLPRPISICEISEDYTKMRLVYRISGKGTDVISKISEGDDVKILGILGNGYDFIKIAAICSGQDNLSDTDCLLEIMDYRIVLMGGGIGIPPMLQTAKELRAHGNYPTMLAGYRDSNLFLDEDLAKYSELKIVTEDGSCGIKGNVLDAYRKEKLNADLIFACGPMPMLRAIAAFVREENEKGKKIEAFVSLEERMACGVGACLGCITKTKDIDDHSNVKNARICTDGPVFRIADLDL